MKHEHEDLSAQVEADWVAFRRWLADRLAGLDEVGDALDVGVTSPVAGDDLDGAARVISFGLWCEGELHAEVASNRTLDERLELSPSAELLLRSDGWMDPDPDVANHWRHAPVTEADHLAVLSVRVLREAYGVVHPAFLVVDGWVDGLAKLTSVMPDETEDEPVDAPFTFAEDSEELTALVDAALEPMLGEVRRDEDGDVMLPAGRSVLFVRTASDLPAVELFAHIVFDVADRERLSSELNILNRTHADLSFFEVNGYVVVRQRLRAWPFVPQQFRAVVSGLLVILDDLARDLAERVGGRRFLDPAADEDLEAADRPEVVEGWAKAASYAALLEMLYDDELDPRSIAALFDSDRDALACAIAAIQDGDLETGLHDPDLVLLHLGRALRVVLGGEVRPRRRLPPRPVSQQLALIDAPDEQELLDLDDAS